MSETVLFGKVKDPELIVCNFRGQTQCRRGGQREGHIEVYPKFWNLNPVTRDKREVLRTRRGRGVSNSRKRNWNRYESVMSYPLPSPSSQR